MIQVHKVLGQGRHTESLAEGSALTPQTLLVRFMQGGGVACPSPVSPSPLSAGSSPSTEAAGFPRLLSPALLGWKPWRAKVSSGFPPGFLSLGKRTPVGTGRPPLGASPQSLSGLWPRRLASFMPLHSLHLLSEAILLPLSLFLAFSLVSGEALSGQVGLGGSTMGLA